MLPRPNTDILFPVFDSSSNLSSSPSPLRVAAWRELLRSYPGDLPTALIGILESGALIGYEGPPQKIISKNHTTVNLAPSEITAKLQADLAANRIAIFPSQHPSSQLISSPLGLVPKHDGGLRRIHDLSYPLGRSVNAHIPQDYGSLQYAKIEDILEKVIRAGRNCLIMKRDLKDAFRNIPVALQMQWLLGFQWENVFYIERCLPFGLATAPFLFNLFAEGLHWILQSWLQWDLLDHYLDDFILIIPLSPSTDSVIQLATSDYIVVTDLLGLPRNDTKDQCGTVVSVLGYEIDTGAFTLRIPVDKLSKAHAITSQVLMSGSMSLHEVDSLAGFLGFCAPAVKLGRVFLRTLWSFSATFPSGRSKFIRKRIHAELRHDLTWWRDLLPKWNGVCFFDSTVRPIISLFTDASGIGMGGFYIRGMEPFDSRLVPLNQAFAVPLPHFDSDAQFDINIYEMEAITLALQLWGPLWASSTVQVFTDNTTAALGLSKQTLKSPANAPLRQALLLAAAHDIILEPSWIEGSTNTLADALSRFDTVTIANLCPHWQNFSLPIPHPLFMCGQPPWST
jgi:reverse transcriptase-like protein